MKYPVDPNRPICVNIGCESPVHLANRSSTGRPVYRPVCGVCHKAKLDLREGVTAVKKDYCENVDSRLGFECTATIIGTYQLDMDHIDGDHYHNVPENIQTICKNCHAVKSRENKDHLNFMKKNKRIRQEGAIKRTEASLLKWEEELKNPLVNDDFKKLIKKKIERAKTTIANTKLV